MQEIKVISGTPTAQLTALAKLQCIMIQSLEKSNPHVHTKMCVHTHMADTQRYISTHMYIIQLQDWLDYYYHYHYYCYYCPGIRIVHEPFNGNEHEQRASFKLFRRAWSAPSGPKCPF